MKKTRILSLVSAFAAIAAGALGLWSRSASAVDETIALGSEATIPIKQEIRSKGSEKYSGTFTYIIEEIDGLNAVSNLSQTQISIEDESFTDSKIEKSIEANLKDTRVIAQPGEYKMKLSCASSTGNFDCSSTYYIFSIFVENVLDSEQVPTGEYTASIVSLRKVDHGQPIATKLAEAYFYAEEELPPDPVYSYIVLKNTVEGNLASKDDVFKYEIIVDGPEGTEYKITAPETTYAFGGKEVTSDTIAQAGGLAIIYLKHGEVAKIGYVDDETPGQILVGSAYSYKEIPDIEDYKTWIDDKEHGNRVEISKIVASEADKNFTLYINSRTKPTIPEKIEDFVNTGLKLKNGAFAILGLGAIVIILVIILQRKKKTSK